jgi:hypothetical protein
MDRPLIYEPMEFVDILKHQFKKLGLPVDAEIEIVRQNWNDLLTIWVFCDRIVQKMEVCLISWMPDDIEEAILIWMGGIADTYRKQCEEWI